jgi:hypothetical protein
MNAYTLCCCKKKSLAEKDRDEKTRALSNAQMIHLDDDARRCKHVREQMDSHRGRIARETQENTDAPRDVR